MHRRRSVSSSAHIAVQITSLILFLVLSLVLVGKSHAAEPPSQFVSRLGAQATAIVTDARLSGPERQQAFRQMLHAYFDVPLIGRFVLGKHWRKASPEERRAFLEVFEAYVLSTYSRRLDGYAGERLEVGSSRDKGRQGVIVPSTLHLPQGGSMSVVWRLRLKGDQWRVFDIIVEGVSMVMTHRAEVDTAIRQGGGFASLLESLRAMVARPTSAEAIQASKL